MLNFFNNGAARACLHMEDNRLQVQAADKVSHFKLGQFIMSMNNKDLGGIETVLTGSCLRWRYWNWWFS
ncbi:hypothetical protein D3C77_656890 [compost metagenome]